MKKTIFSTPIIRPLLRGIALVMIRLSGWRVRGELPSERKYVLIGAPHTSNWDFVLMMLFMFAMRMEVHWMGKHTLFPWPLAGLVKWLGGIPIDRRQANNTVDQVIGHFRKHPELVVLIPPEGTRRKVERWKTGFYHIAAGAGIPIVLGFIDASRKEMGLLGVFHPSGDIERDMPLIQAHYKSVVGLNPANQ